LPPRRDSDTGSDMTTEHAIALTLALSASLVACGPPPKQAAPPEFTDEGKQDMSSESVDTQKELAPAKKMPDEMTPTEKKQACCPQCEKGLANDRTGQKADQIPCADYVASLEVRGFCIDYFRGNQMKASECKGVGPSTPPASGSAAPAASGSAAPAAPPASGKPPASVK
jgi:hypothetical protein